MLSTRATEFQALTGTQMRNPTQQARRIATTSSTSRSRRRRRDGRGAGALGDPFGRGAGEPGGRDEPEEGEDEAVEDEVCRTADPEHVGEVGEQTSWVENRPHGEGGEEEQAQA